MACNNVESILFDCGDKTIGGIDAVYLTDRDNIVTETPNTTAWTMSLSASTTLETVEFRKNSGSYTEDYTRDNAGAVIYNKTITIPLHGRDAGKSRKINILGEGQRRLAIIVKMNSGEYVYFEDMQLETVADGSGAAKAEGSKYTITFQGEAENLSYFMDEADVLVLI